MRAKQRKERDISSLSAEMRQMEEQYVISPSRASFPLQSRNLCDGALHTNIRSPSQIHAIRLQEDAAPVILPSDPDHLHGDGDIVHGTCFFETSDAHDDR